MLDSSITPVAMCVAGGTVLVIGAGAARKPVADARGLDKIVALANICYAVPMAMFGTLHLFGPDFVKPLVPPYMPGRMFWVYLVGIALVSAAFSIALRIGVRWSGLLIGLTMFGFVAMIHLPGALRQPGRIIWTIVCRELSFGGAGWLLAASAVDGWRGRDQKVLTIAGRSVITLALVVFGIEHFLHPTGLPGVPLVRQMADAIPGREVIDYLTGAGLLLTAASVLLNRKTRVVAACVGGWLLLLVLVIYGPVLAFGLGQAGVGPRLEGVNYFADTLLFTGVILALAGASPPQTKPS
jgi:uncharacterized membrane protein